MKKLILLSTLTFSFFTFAVETTKIGDVDLGETEHSEAFLFIKNLICIILLQYKNVTKVYNM